jgi:galactonate dehydratase
MKIRKVEPILCQGGVRNWVFVKVTTDEGIVGYGDGTDWFGERAIAAYVEYLERFVVGEDPFNIEKIWQKMYLSSYVPGKVISCAITGIETALWDIVGKTLGRPVYDLLGGKCRDSVPLYYDYCDAWKHTWKDYEGSGDRSLEGIAKQAKFIKNREFKALKCHPVRPRSSERTIQRWIDESFVKKTVDKIRTIRETVGDEFYICLDVNNMFDVPHAIKMAREMEPYKLLFMEDPIRQDESPMSTKMVRDATETPIGTGENLYTIWDFRNYFEIQALDLTLLDVCHCGISQAKKIAALSEAYHLPLCPHNPNSPLSTIISGHLCTNLPNFLYLEYWSEDIEPPWRDKVMSPPLNIREGNLILSDKPGYGVDLNEDEIAKHPYDVLHK